MTKSTATIKKPSPQQRDKNPPGVGDTGNSTGVFVSMALDMSWRLAIVVLVPVLGGVELDRKFNTVPILTILGFILAMAGMALVMRQTLQAANNIQIPKKGSRS